MSCPLGDKKGRSADSSDLTRLHRETADLAAYISYTELEDNKKLKEQISADSNFSLTRGGLTLLANSTIGFTRNPVTGEIVYPPYSGQRTSSSSQTGLIIRWVAGGSDDEGSVLAYSFNGITWSAVDVSSIFSVVFGIASNGTMWVAGGESAGVGGTTLAYSYDGITWEPSANGSSIINVRARAIAWNGTRWVVGGTGTSTLAYSDNGITWISSSSYLFDVVNAVAGNGTRWVVGGQGTTGNRLGYSSDNGVTWQPSPSGNLRFNSVAAVAWNGTMWVAGGEGTTNHLAYSTDGGISWQTASDVTTFLTFVRAVAWNGTLWVAGGTGTTPGNRLIYSYDGINWEPSDNGDSSLFLDNLNTVAWDRTMSRWVAGGEGTNTLAFSADGNTWVPSSNGNDVLNRATTVAAK
jgi:hypothetical protein